MRLTACDAFQGVAGGIRRNGNVHLGGTQHALPPDSNLQGSLAVIASYLQTAILRLQ